MNPYKIENQLNRIIMKVNSVQSELNALGFGDLKEIKTVKLSLTEYNERAYVNIAEAFNFVVNGLEPLAKLVGVVPAVRFKSRGLTLLQLGMDIDTNMIILGNFLVKLSRELEMIGVEVNLDDVKWEADTDVDESEDDDAGEVWPEVINKGWTRVATSSESDWATTQGAGFDEEYYYVFGSKTGNGGKTQLSAIHKSDPNKSFIATGDLGVFISGTEVDLPENYQYPLGHANDCVVISRKDNIVKLLVSSMLPKEMATCLVDLEKQTATIGVRVPISGFNGWSSSAQKLPDGRIMVRSSGYYWIAEYNETELVFKKTAKLPNLNQVVQSLGFDSEAIYQADWYDNGFFYTIAWLPKLNKSLVVETISNSIEASNRFTNRYWIGDDNGRKFEVEKVWFENGQMMFNVTQNKPNDNWVGEAHWRY